VVCCYAGGTTLSRFTGIVATDSKFIISSRRRATFINSVRMGSMLKTILMRKKLVLLLLVFSLFQSTSGQVNCENIEQLKTRTYGFRPKELSQKQIESKNKDLNHFWDEIKKHGEMGIECLKGLIETEVKDSYFCWDGSALLAQIDTTDKSLDIVKKGLDKCELSDLQLEPFLHLSYFLGQKGKNISSLALKLISEPNATVFLTNHVITLSSIDASLFLFNQLRTDSAERLLISTVLNGNPTAKYNAAVLLNLLSTDNGDKLLDSLSKENKLDPKTLEFIASDRKNFITTKTGNISRETVLTDLKDTPYNLEKNFFGFSGNEDLIHSACTQLNKPDVDLIRQARYKVLPAISDEALHEYFALTTILMTVRNKKN
jgi:hypothetical protein